MIGNIRGKHLYLMRYSKRILFDSSPYENPKMVTDTHWVMVELGWKLMQSLIYFFLHIMAYEETQA